MNNDRIGAFEIWGRGRAVRIESPLSAGSLIARIEASLGQPLAGPLEWVMPDLEPRHPLQGTISGSALRLRSPLNPRSLAPGTHARALLVGKVVANAAGDSTIVGRVGLSSAFQILCACSTVTLLGAMFAFVGSLVGAVMAIAAVLGFIRTSFVSVGSAREVVTATASLASWAS